MSDPTQYIDGSSPVALDICRAFGVQPENVQKIVFTLAADSVATLEIYRYATNAKAIEQIGEQIAGEIQHVEHEIS